MAMQQKPLPQYRSAAGLHAATGCGESRLSVLLPSRISWLQQGRVVRRSVCSVCAVRVVCGTTTTVMPAVWSY